MDRKYAVVVFEDDSVQALPVSWLNEIDEELVAYWPPAFWKEEKIRKAIEKSEECDVKTFTLHKNVRLLHTYNSLLVARSNCKVALVTSSLETESEDLLAPRGRRKRIRMVIDSDEEMESPPKRSRYPSAPVINKAVQNKIKVKLQGKISSPAKSTTPEKLTSQRSKTKEKRSSPTKVKTPVKSSESHKKSPGKSHPKSPASEWLITDTVALVESPLRCDHDVGNDDMDSLFGENTNRSPLTKESVKRGLQFDVPASKKSSPVKPKGAHSLSSQLRNDTSISKNRSPMKIKESRLSSHSKSHDDSIKVGRKKVSMKPLSEAEHMTVVSLLMEVRNQQEKQERLLGSILRAVRPSQKVTVPKDLLPLPLKTIEDFNNNEKYLSDSTNRTETVEYLSDYVNSSLSLKEQVYALLKKVMSDNLACEFNWKGTGCKSSFGDTHLCSSLTGATVVKQKDSSTPANVSDVEIAIKDWLKYAPKRNKSPKIVRKKSPKKAKSPSKSPSSRGRSPDSPSPLKSP